MMAHRLRTTTPYLACILSSLLTGLSITGGSIAVPFIVQLSPSTSVPLEALRPRTQRTLVLHSVDGIPFARRGGCVAEPVELAETPRHFIDALLSMEDRRFYYHLGIDPIGIGALRDTIAKLVESHRAAARSPNNW